MESPERRPNFEEIKSELDTAYNSLPAQLKTNGKRKGEENQQACNFPMIKWVNNSMQSRYTSMIKGNKAQLKRIGSLGRKSCQYLSMKKIGPCHNSISLECEVDFLTKNENNQDLKIEHANKCQKDTIKCVEAMEANTRFKDIELKEKQKKELKRSLSEPKISSSIQISTYIVSAKSECTL
jgi:hypothetical protein